MPENSDYNKPISGKRLKEALVETTLVLGRASCDSMFHDLELNGITFRERSYTLQEIQGALRKIFGHDGTALLMQRLQKVLK
ncbi:MAG TPA: hypothetical protein VD736_02370 [Nitrososphaera sp.]|nr:hypothetical protein [Nitrososphaera sp.]